MWLDDFTGEFYPPQRPITNRRMYDTFSLHYILRGHGFFSAGKDAPHRLGPGDIFFIYLRRPINYYPDPEDPWCYCGISLSAPAEGEFFRRIGLSDSAVLPACAENERIGDEIAGAVAGKMSGDLGDFGLSACLCSVLEILSRKYAKEPCAVPAGTAHALVARAREYLEMHYSDPGLRLSDVCAAVNLSHSYLCRIFRREMGCSAEHYLTECRLSAADRMLRSTDYTVGEIAFLCGYTDAAQFSRMYKKRFGMPPLCARKGTA